MDIIKNKVILSQIKKLKKTGLKISCLICGQFKSYSSEGPRHGSHFTLYSVCNLHSFYSPVVGCASLMI